MALQFNRTDASTGHQYTVYARIDDAVIGLSDNTCVIKLNLYDSVGAAKSTPPLATVMPADSIVLTPAETAQLRVSGLALLYGILKARTAYSVALDV